MLRETLYSDCEFFSEIASLWFSGFAQVKQMAKKHGYSSTSLAAAQPEKVDPVFVWDHRVNFADSSGMLEKVLRRVSSPLFLIFAAGPGATRASLPQPLIFPGPS
jgi:hypothetical protein